MDPGEQAAKDQIWQQIKNYRSDMETVACASNTQISRLLKQDANHTQVYRALCQIGLTELELIKADLGLDDEFLSPGYRRLADMFTEQKDDDAEREAALIAQNVLGEVIAESLEKDDPNHPAEYIETNFHSRLQEEADKYAELNDDTHVIEALRSWLWLSKTQERFRKAVEIVLESSTSGKEWTVGAIVAQIKRNEG